MRKFIELNDMEGTPIYEGDLINVFLTSYDGENNHDCVYKVGKINYLGVELTFQSLLWESYGFNQLPIYTRLRFGHELNVNRKGIHTVELYEENHMMRNRWKTNDVSYYFKKIKDSNNLNK